MNEFAKARKMRDYVEYYFADFVQKFCQQKIYGFKGYTPPPFTEFLFKKG